VQHHRQQHRHRVDLDVLLLFDLLSDEQSSMVQALLRLHLMIHIHLKDADVYQTFDVLFFSFFRPFDCRQLLPLHLITIDCDLPVQVEMRHDRDLLMDPVDVVDALRAEHRLLASTSWMIRQVVEWWVR
jgi:hypothetical protein